MFDDIEEPKEVEYTGDEYKTTLGKITEKNIEETENYINKYAEIKKRINKQYPQTKKFKKIKDFSEGNLLRKIYKDNKKDFKNIIQTTDNFPLTFILETKKYILIKYMVLNEIGVLIFYNNEKDIDELISKKLQKIECGQYEIKEMQIGYAYNKIEIQENTILTLANNIKQDIYDDVKYFMKNKKFYDENNFTYKRGLLLYGSPGNGKTTLIRDLIKNNKNVYSFVIDSKVNFNNDLLESIKYVSGDSLKIIILEDIDRCESYYLSSLLNMLDGVIKIDGFYIIATCNDLSKVDKALLNRPSRFDKIYIIDDPNEKQREDLLLFYFPDISKDDLKKCINLTKGFNCAYFKEIFMSSKIHNLSPIKSVEYIKERLAIFNIKKNNSYTG